MHLRFHVQTSVLVCVLSSTPIHQPHFRNVSSTLIMLSLPGVDTLRKTQDVDREHFVYIFSRNIQMADKEKEKEQIQCSLAEILKVFGNLLEGLKAFLQQILPHLVP